MDYSNRNPQQVPVNPVQPVNNGPAHKQHKVRSSNRNGMWGRIGIVAAILAVVILFIGVILLLYSGNNTKTDESKYIYTNKLQAVFLNTGQVYFGNIKTLNQQYLVLTNIFYLQTTNSSGSSSSSSSANNNVTLVKLGCELHMPYDQMVINDTQVTFWENLQDNGQVAKAVSTFEKQNPNGQKCADQSTSSSNTSSSVQNSNSNSGTTPSSSSGH